MKKLGVFNQKGGVGKTTSTFNLAGEFAIRGNKVLVVDCDPQGNAGKSFTLEYEHVPYTLSDVLNGDVSINEAIVPSLFSSRQNSTPKYHGIDVLTSGIGLAAFNPTDDFQLRDALKNITKDYDIVIFDCPPNVSPLTINILTCIDRVIVPATVDDDSIDGYGELLDTVEIIKENNNPNLEVMGVFFTIVVKNENYDKDYLEEAKKYLGNRIFDTSIKRSTFVKQSRSLGRPLCWYRSTKEVTQNYRDLADEIIARF